jgi:hypothetical protein
VTRLLGIVDVVAVAAGVRPDLIVIGGGVSRAVLRWQTLISASARIVPAVLQKNSGIIGAAIAATEELRTAKRWVEAEQNFGLRSFPPLFNSPQLFPDDFLLLCRAVSAQGEIARPRAGEGPHTPAPL